MGIGTGIVYNPGVPQGGAVTPSGGAALASGVPVIGQGGTDVKTISSATEARVADQTLGTWYVIGRSAVATPLTGSTVETALATIPIPAGAMGPNGIIRMWALSSNNNSGNNKILRFRLGGMSGAQLAAITVTTTTIIQTCHWIQNRNAQNSQVFGPSTVNPFVTSGAANTAAIDTSAAVDVLITGQLADGGDNIQLESYLVELLYGA